MRAGPLPDSLAVMPSMVVLDLAGNQLTGTLENYAIATQVARDDLNSPCASSASLATPSQVLAVSTLCSVQPDPRQSWPLSPEPERTALTWPMHGLCWD